MRRKNRLALWSLVLFSLSALPACSYSQSIPSDKNKPEGSELSTAPVTKTPQVRLRFVETVSSADAKAGQVVLLEAAETVEDSGKPIVAKGAPAIATVSAVRRRGRNRREGTLVLNLNSVKRVDGTDAQLQSSVLKKGGGGDLPIFGPCTFPIPADPVGLFRRGMNVVIPKGTEVVAIIVAQPSR